MKALVTLEDHLWRHGQAILGDGPDDYSSWSELLRVFDEVVLLARVSPQTGPRAAGLRIDGPRVSVRILPDYAGPWGYLKNQRTLHRLVRAAARECDAYFLRIPGSVAYSLWRELVRTARSYAVDVVGDPWDAFAPGTMRGLFRPLYRRVVTHITKQICSRADAALYCSGGVLRKRYAPAQPCHTAVAPRLHTPSGYASPELLTERALRIQKWHAGRTPRGPRLRLGLMGSLAQLYKGPDILIRAAHQLVQAGVGIEVFIAGDGRYRPSMERLAKELRVDDRVRFLGHLPFGKPVFEFLDSLDLFVMPSRAEAFGRALFEAMARGCPSIGADIGGIAELLDREDLFRTGDAESLATKVLEVTADPHRLSRMSARNLSRAREFDQNTLVMVREQFYRCMRPGFRSSVNGGKASKAASARQS